jgi:hypothetical protein
VPAPDVRWIGRRHGRRQDRRWAKSWSPQQIANRLRVDFPHDETMRISHEAIYQALYMQGRGALRRELEVASALLEKGEMEERLTATPSSSRARSTLSRTCCATASSGPDSFLGAPSTACSRKLVAWARR